MSTPAPATTSSTSPTTSATQRFRDGAPGCCEGAAGGSTRGGSPGGDSTTELDDPAPAVPGPEGTPAAVVGTPAPATDPTGTRTGAAAGADRCPPAAEGPDAASSGAPCRGPRDIDPTGRSPPTADAWALLRGSGPARVGAATFVLRDSASRAAPRATACLGCAPTTVGRPKASETIWATSGIRDEPPTSSTAASVAVSTCAARTTRSRVPIVDSIGARIMRSS